MAARAKQITRRVAPLVASLFFSIIADEEPHERPGVREGSRHPYRAAAPTARSSPSRLQTALDDEPMRRSLTDQNLDDLVGRREAFGRIDLQAFQNDSFPIL